MTRPPPKPGDLEKAVEVPEIREGEDFYIDEHGLLVFTERYHRKRGYCCQNGCRHCPYGPAEKR